MNVMKGILCIVNCCQGNISPSQGESDYNLLAMSDVYHTKSNLNFSQRRLKEIEIKKNAKISSAPIKLKAMSYFSQ